ELDDGVSCHSCHGGMAEYAYYDGRENYYCEAYAQALTEQWFDEAQAFAEEHCEITGKLPRYDPACESRCTPEEYAAGYAESYTPNAYHCPCRPRCTNYEKFTAGLSRDGAEDRVYYTMIRHRIDELLMEHDDYMRGEDGEPESPPA